MDARDGKGQADSVSVETDLKRWLWVLSLISLTSATPALAQIRVVTSTGAFAASGVQLDRAVAQVDTAVFTLSELLSEARLTILRHTGVDSFSSFRLGSSKLGRVFDVLEGAEGDTEARDAAEVLSSVLSVMVQRALLMTEVRRLQLRPVPEEEVRRAYRTLLAEIRERRQRKSWWGTPGNPSAQDLLDRIGFRHQGRDYPPINLAAILRAERAVEKIETFRRASRRRMPEALLRSCFERRAEELGYPSFDDVRQRLENEMRSHAFAIRLREQLEQLATRVVVRYAPPFGPRPFDDLELCPSAEVIRQLLIP